MGAGAGGGVAPAIVDLAVRGIADIEAAGAVLGGAAHIGPGADSLRRQGLHWPGAAHLIGDDAFDVVLPVHHVDDTELAPGDTGILKTAPVLIEPEPGLRRPPLAIRQDGEAPAALAVKLEEDGIGLCHRHHHAGAAGLHGAAVQPGAGEGQDRLILGLIAAQAQTVGVGNIGDMAAGIALRHSGGLLVAAVGLANFRPPFSDDALPLVGLIVATAAEVNGPRRRDGDGGPPGLPHFHEVTAAVVVAEGIAAAHGVLQIGGEHGTAAVAQPHLHDVVLHGGRRPAANQNRQQKAKAPTQFFHATSPSPRS